MNSDWIDDEGFRANVGIILTDDRGKLMIAGRVGSKGWQFPQGGMLRGEVEPTYTPRQPLDVLAQQIVAMAGNEELEVDALFALVRQAWPYRELADEQFLSVVRMLADGYATRRGRHGAMVFYS